MWAFMGTGKKLIVVQCHTNGFVGHFYYSQACCRKLYFSNGICYFMPGVFFVGVHFNFPADYAEVADKKNASSAHLQLLA
jgi:hypothetical protein